MFATIAGLLCDEPVNVESSTPQAIKETNPQKRHVISDCDGPGGLIGLHGGLSGELIHGGLGLGLHGHGYAPSYSSGYLASGGIASSIGHYGSSAQFGHYGSSGSIGHLGSIGGHIGGLGAIISSPHVISGGYAPHAPIFGSSVISQAPIAIAAPTVCYSIISYNFYS